MLTKSLTILSALTMMLVINGCGNDTPSTPDTSEPTAEEIIAANAEWVKRAALMFADSNNGECAKDIGTDTTIYGLTLLDFLPRRELLINPYTGERTEPRDGLTGIPGAIGYQRNTAYSAPSTFVVSGWSETERVVMLDNLDELEFRAIQGAHVVIAAVEAFAADNDGWYPNNVGGHRNDAGKWVHNYLPDGKMIANPFWLLNANPTDGLATNEGNIGYAPIVDRGFNVGFTIRVIGREVGISILEHEQRIDVPETFFQNLQVEDNARRVFEAAQEFALQNKGIFPTDANTATTQAGETLRDLLGDEIINPYTQVRNEPINGAAATRGQTGYQVLTDGIGIIGCTVTGVGDEDGVTLITLSTHPHLSGSGAE